MSRLFILPYKLGAKSAKALADALGCKQLVRPEILKYDDFVVCWGKPHTPLPEWRYSFLNSNASKALDKIQQLTLFSNNEVPTIAFTTSKDEAQNWLNGNHTVFCRLSLRGHSGEGIVVVEPGEQLVDAPLYTLYMKKKHEYRIHVFCDSVIKIQQKLRKKDNEVADTKIRNHHNGYVFCNPTVQPSTDILQACAKAVKSLGLDFGAVDIIHNEHYNTYAVLEVNTAPGLEGSTIDAYKQAIQNWLP